jgi:hypothetical protein
MSVRIVDLYFDEPVPVLKGVDIIRYNQAGSPIVGAACTPFSTIAIDLSKSEDELRSNLKSHNRYKIRRASEKDDLVYEYSNDGNWDAILRFADHFDRCAALKHLGEVSRERLRILAENRALDLSFVSNKSGDLLAASSYLLTPTRIRGLYAAAAFRTTTDQSLRTIIGRANRYLYWRDILRFKEAGILIFDFGGYYTGNEDEERLRVNVFKAEFGGQVLHEFNCQQATSLQGRVALWAIEQRAQWLARKRAQAMQAEPAQEEYHPSSIPSSV